MPDHVDYFFTSVSPFAWLGHNQLMEIAAKHDKKINFRPFDLMGVWENSGAVMPAKRPPVRQRYRLVELQRISAARAMKLNLAPAHFPTNPAAADHCVCALVLDGQDPAGFLFDVARAVWVNDQQIADEAVLAEILNSHGHDADAVLARSKSGEALDMRQENTKLAVASDAIGAPAYLYNGEVFWGQDRLDLLDQMIALGRGPFLAEA